jgi:hypothetical protein
MMTDAMLRDLHGYGRRCPLALAVDIRHLQRDDLGHAQAGAIGDAKRRLVFDAGRGLEEARHFLGAQHDRRLARLPHEGQTLNQIGSFERHLEEEPQRDNRAIDARRCPYRKLYSLA